MLFTCWGLWMLALCPMIIIAAGADRIDGLVGHPSLPQTYHPPSPPTSDTVLPLGADARQTTHDIAPLPTSQPSQHQSWTDKDGLPETLTIDRGGGRIKEGNTRNIVSGGDVSQLTYDHRGNGNNGTHQLKVQTNVRVPEDDNLRGIMENFADDFDSPPDALFSDDIFNREPFYYDEYYDVFGSADAAPQLTQGGAEVSNSLVPEEPTISSADQLPGDLEMRLLGPDLQDQLGYVLGHLTNGSLRNRRHQAPVRHHDPHQSGGIPVGIEEGSCPPPVHSLPPGLCAAPPCTSHMMCYPQKKCCFNGCTYTCTQPVKPPPVIDWLEDSSLRLPLLDPTNPSLPRRFESSPLSYGTGGGETVRLPGGCSLSTEKYEELKQFMTSESIQDCLCSRGEVVCVVRSSPAT